MSDPRKRVRWVPQAAFIRKYCTESGLSLAEFNVSWKALPCDCGDPSCVGWAVVTNTPEAMDLHRRLYTHDG